MTLEGKLEGVNVGDIILIQGRQGNAVGYVEMINDNFICLTQRDFQSKSISYHLHEFETYEVLKKKKSVTW